MSTRGNIGTMAKQGCAPRVTELYNKLTQDPFSQCFFLGKLFDAKQAELQKEKPHYFHEENSREIIRLRVELILVKMCQHIETIRLNALRTME